MTFLSLAAVAAAVTQQLPPTTTVFTPGEGGYEAFRIPGVISLNNTILVFAEGRKYGCGDFAGQHDVVYKRSTDHGKTWSALSTLLDPLKQFGLTQCPASAVKSENASCE
jgi:sialidase-1